MQKKILPLIVFVILITIVGCKTAEETEKVQRPEILNSYIYCAYFNSFAYASNVGSLGTQLHVVVNITCKVDVELDCWNIRLFDKTGGVISEVSSDGSVKTMPIANAQFYKAPSYRDMWSFMLYCYDFYDDPYNGKIPTEIEVSVTIRDAQGIEKGFLERYDIDHQIR